jgi:altronate hydrolase
MKEFIRIHPEDNVIVALKDLRKGHIILLDHREIKLLEDIKRGHKAAAAPIIKGENVIKYGSAIGHAIENISAGSWIHSHNLKTNLEGLLQYSYKKEINQLEKGNTSPLTFKGYRREDGKVGIRNELWIVPTVGCVNGIGESIIKRFKKEVCLETDEVVEVFRHNYGCSQLGEDHENTRTILGDIVKHPNAGGVLVIGLGCENNYLSAFKENLGNYNEKRVRFLVTQEVGDEVEAGAVILKELHEQMKQDKRVDIPISELKVGLKCGGSDGFSGITANPLLGAFSDFLTAQGGTTVLTEVPEMFGAETILMKRAKTKEVFNKTVNLINDFKEYFMQHNQPVYENPSPGNKEGGITTLEEKSLGCIQKGGRVEVVDVLAYGELISEKGLNLLNSPGNDLVSSTALAASGCHLILFTTGRGTPFGTFVPTVKISTNTELYKLKPHWIDFNAGTLVENSTMEELLEGFIEYIIVTASGKWINNENMGIREIAIFKTGVIL